MKRVYVAGPLTPAKRWSDNYAIDYLVNARNMLRLGVELLKLGLAPYVPALDMLLFLSMDDGFTLDEYTIKSLSIEWLACCDAVVLAPGWQDSPGVKVELEMADKYNIPIFYSLEELKAKVGEIKRDTVS